MCIHYCLKPIRCDFSSIGSASQHFKGVLKKLPTEKAFQACVPPSVAPFFEKQSDLQFESALITFQCLQTVTFLFCPQFIILICEQISIVQEDLLLLEPELNEL